MFDLLIAALALFLGLVLFGFGMVGVFGSGRIGLLWIYAAVVLIVFAAAFRRLSRRGDPVSKTLWIRKAATALCLALFAGALTGFAGYAASSRPPSQATVAASLAEHRADFLSLKDMVIADGFSTLLDFGSEFARPTEPFRFKPITDSDLGAERVTRYRELMRRVDAPRIDVWTDGTIHFSVAGWGAANRGWRMSLTFSASEPKPLVPTVDGFQPGREEGAPKHAYSRLDGPWYLYMTW